jgi:hypothetical protein
MRLQRGLVLYGHIHVRIHCVLRTNGGALDVVSASGAALDHPDASIRAGFNLYDIDDAGTLARMEACAVDARGESMVPATIREFSSC